MTQLYTKVKLYLEANGKTEDEFETPLSSGTVFLRNEGELPSDAFIDRWEVSGLAQPTEEQLNAFEDEARILESDNQIINSRKTEYPTIEECVHAILDDDLDALQVLRQAVKDKYPK